MTTTSGWSDNFASDSNLNSSLFPITWGQNEFSFGSNGLTIGSNSGSAGFMVSDHGSGDGSGYGTYSATFSMKGSGAYVDLWPSSNAWPGPEIDLAEQNTSGQTYLTVHWKGSNGGNGYHDVVFNADISKQTTVSADWEASGLTFDVNGQQVAHFAAGGSIPVPKDSADGGQNESFGVGTDGGSGASITISHMSYSPSGSQSSGGSSGGGSGGSSTPPPSIKPSASIAVSSPGMHFISNPAAGADVPLTLSDPGLKDVYAFVMNSQNQAESNWIEIPLNASGSATHTFHFANSGDYVLAVNDPTTQADRGYSGHITIASSHT